MMISQSEIDRTLEPVYDELASMAPLLAAAPYSLIKRVMSDIRKRTEAALAERCPSLDETTVTQIVNSYIERVEARIELVCKIAEAGGRA